MAFTLAQPYQGRAIPVYMRLEGMMSKTLVTPKGRTLVTPKGRTLRLLAFAYALGSAVGVA